LRKGHENNLNSFNTKGYRHPTGDVYLQKRPDLSSIPLNLPLFSKTSLVTSHVHSVEHLFKRPYAVRNCPEKPPTTYPYIHLQPLKRSVKTRRKSLVSNKVYLQIGETDCITAETQRWRSHSIKCAFGTAEIRREERRKPYIIEGKDKNSKKRIKRSFDVSKDYNTSCIRMRTSGMEGR
jgi:hypothetical protein